jgi:hypothetical protein
MNPKTDLPCDCGSITHQISEPDSPVSVENGLFLINETWVMYFCPFCGGKLPDDSKPIYVPYITAEERARLETLVEDIQTPEEAIERPGTPEYDELMLTYYREGEVLPYVYSGPEDEHLAIQKAGKFKLDESAVATRNIEFYFDGGKLTNCRLVPKWLPPRHLEEGEVI